MSDGIEISVHTGATRHGWLTRMQRVEWTPRHNGIGTVVVELATSDWLTSRMMTDGTWCRATFRGQQITGSVISWELAGPTRSAVLTATIESDLALLRDMLAYPTPGADLASQTSAYDRRTGVAETVIKGYVAANAGRFSAIGVDVAPDQKRGAVIDLASPGARMTPMQDLFDGRTGGLGISVLRQDSGRLLVDVYEPKVWTPALEESAGTLKSWKVTHTRATATSIVGMGADELANRAFRGSTDAALEAAQGWRSEVAVDMRDLQVDLSSTDMNTTAKVQAAMDKRISDELSQHAATSGLSIELAERDIFAYGGDEGVIVGDQLQVKVGDPSAPAIWSDVLTECRVTWTPASTELEPGLGELSNTDPDMQRVVALNKIAAQVRRLEAGS